MSMRPAPRSIRAFDCWASSRTPVALAMRPATSSALARSATPESISVVRWPERIAATAAAMCGCSTRARASGGVTALSGARGFGPGRVGGQDQRRDAPGRGARLRDRLRGIARHMVGFGHPVHPVRHRTRQAFDVAGQRRVVLQVIGGVIADDVDDRRAGALGVVQVGQAVGQARAQVQQGRRRLFRHARIAVGGAGHHAFEQAQHAAHLRLAVQRRDEMHFGGAGIGETGVDTAGQQGVAEGVRAVHIRSLCSWVLPV